jgi:hypothetical protein
MTAAGIEAEKVEQVARAGLAHATWGAQNSGCAGDMSMSTVPFGEGNYTATVDSAAATTQYTLNPDRDTFIREINPDNNYGTDAGIFSGAGRRGLIHFDLASITAGSRVVSATLWLYVSTNDPQDAVNLHPVTADWTETGATWNTTASRYDSAVFGVIPPQPAAHAWVSVNLTALTQSWVNNAAANHGLMLIAESATIDSRFRSRDNVSTAEHPYLQITTADAPVSPVQITTTGTLTGNPSPANDITRTLTHTAVPAYQPPGTVALQLGTDAGEDGMPDSFYELRNYGGADYLQVHDNGSDWQQYPLIRFDLAGLPPGAAVRSARLELNLQSLNAPGTATIHQVTRSWVEGTKSGGGTADGATWFLHDGTNAWTSAGGDINAPVVAETAINGGETWVSWEIAPLVERWLAGEPNHGLQIRPGNGLEQANFASKEDATAGVQPKLTIEYACECGSPCIAPQGNGNVVLVVVNPTTLVPADAYKKALFESWGYTVSPLSESANQASYDSAVAAADVVYISETVNSTQVGSKLVNAPIGVITEDGLYNDDLGISNNAGVTTGSAINVTDASHYITGIFPAGPLEIYDADMEQLVIFNGPAPDLQTLADVSGYSSLVTLEAGATLKGGATAAGPRAMLPLGRVANFNWDYLNHNGRLIVQRALQWGTGNTGGSLPQLLFVAASLTPTAQEQLRIDLIESWGYTVNLIADEDSQANFDAAVAANDVIYVSQEAQATSLGTKLVASGIGLVNENKDMIDEFGFATGLSMGGGLPTLSVDLDHYITSVFTANPVAPYAANDWYQIVNEPVAAGVDPVGTWVESPWTGKPALMALPMGADLIGGGTAAGRRVQLPWGSGEGSTPVALTSLSDDARTIIKRSLEWAEGAGCASLKPLLLVVSDAVTPTGQESARKTLIESWCYAVTLIDDDATSGEFAAAMAVNDVIYISQEIANTTVASKLKDATIGIVNEEYLMSSGLGFGSGTGSGFYNDINLVDNTHYITSGFATGALALFDPAYDIYTGTSFTLAPDLQVLGEAGSITGLAALEAGGALWDSGTASGRRVLVPWGDDFSALNADGQTIMQRAIEWAVTPPPAPAPAYNVLMIVGNLTLTSKDIGYKALIESWGHTVSLIDDGDSQANYDAAMDAADVILASGSAIGSSILDKPTNTTKGLVNEVNGKIDNFGFSSSTSATANFDTFSKTDAGHYITEPFSGNAVTVFTSSLTNPVPGGTLAPDLSPVGEVSGTLALGTLDTGATRYDSNPSQGRRVQMPFASAEATDLTADGETILQRALEWAAGAGGGGGGGGGGGPTGVVFEEFTEAALSNGTSLVINKPAGTATGDLLIAAVATDGNTATSLTPPTGWNVVHVADQSGAVTFGVWWKLAGASEPGSYNFTWSGSEHAYGWVMRFTGHDPASPVHASSNDAGSGSAPASPSVTTTVDNALILRLGGFDDDDINAGDPGLSGHTAINMGDSGNGPTTASGGSGYVLQPAAGDSGTSAFTLTGSEEYVTVTLAIAPAP